MTANEKIRDAMRRVQSDVDGLLRVDGTVGADRMRNAVLAALEEASVDSVGDGTPALPECSEPGNAEMADRLLRLVEHFAINHPGHAALTAKAQVFATLATGDAILAAAHIIAGEK